MSTLPSLTTQEPAEADALINPLIELELAGMQRCELCAALLPEGPLQALLLLQAAAHREASLRLNDIMVVLRGTPAAGTADAARVDPASPGLPLNRPEPGALLASCIAEAEGGVAMYRRTLQAPDLPPQAVPWLKAEMEHAQIRLRQLMAAEEKVVPGPAADDKAAPVSPAEGTAVQGV